MNVSLFLSIISILVVVTNFVLSILDRGKKNQKENHQELIEYKIEELKNDYKETTNDMKDDYKSMASDIKDIKKLLIEYKETMRNIAKEEIAEHVKLYHSREA